VKGRRPNIAMSHELAGIAAGVRPDVVQWRVEDRMAGSLTQSSGMCARCLSGRPFSSYRRVTLDPRRDWVFQGLGLGGFAERALIHENQMAVVRPCRGST
jgi:S-(hydroxymethyl)glutathione dehydrogenase / alcohol dehydrogenase